MPVPDAMPGCADPLASVGLPEVSSSFQYSVGVIDVAVSAAASGGRVTSAWR